jgi:hypothetical protein
MRRWKDNIKMELQEIEFEGVDWTDMAEDRHKLRDFVNTVINLRVP